MKTKNNFHTLEVIQELLGTLWCNDHTADRCSKEGVVVQCIPFPAEDGFNLQVVIRAANEVIELKGCRVQLKGTDGQSHYANLHSAKVLGAVAHFMNLPVGDYSLDLLSVSPQIEEPPQPPIDAEGELRETASPGETPPTPPVYVVPLGPLEPVENPSPAAIRQLLERVARLELQAQRSNDVFSQMIHQMAHMSRNLTLAIASRKYNHPEENVVGTLTAFSSSLSQWLKIRFGQNLSFRVAVSAFVSAVKLEVIASSDAGSESLAGSPNDLGAPERELLALRDGGTAFAARSNFSAVPIRGPRSEGEIRDNTAGFLVFECFDSEGKGAPYRNADSDIIPDVRELLCGYADAMFPFVTPQIERFEESGSSRCAELGTIDYDFAKQLVKVYKKRSWEVADMPRTPDYSEPHVSGN